MGYYLDIGSTEDSTVTSRYNGDGLSAETEM